MKKLILSSLILILPAVSQAGFQYNFTCVAADKQAYLFTLNTMVKDENGDMHTFSACEILSEKNQGQLCPQVIGQIDLQALRFQMSVASEEEKQITNLTPEIIRAQKLSKEVGSFSTWYQLKAAAGSYQGNYVLDLVCAKEDSQ